MRGFFAFGVHAEFSRELVDILARLPADPRLKPLQREEFHVTIKFLSNFSSTDFFACLLELLAIGAPPPNSLKAGSLAFWPTVLVLECEPTEELRAWHRQVNTLLERKGFLVERHPEFSPHITLARQSKAIPETHAHLPGVENIFRDRIIPLAVPALWRSEPEESGRRHREILSVWYR